MKRREEERIEKNRVEQEQEIVFSIYLLTSKNCC